MLKVGDRVKFAPITGDEIYIRSIPSDNGEIVSLGFDKSHFLVWGTLLSTAEVKFDGGETEIIYLEDLKKIEDEVT